MSRWELTLDDTTLTGTDAEHADGWLIFTALDETGDMGWQVRLDATVDHGDLMSITTRPDVLDNTLLVSTAGEHSRGATIHRHRLHAVDCRGRLLWTHEWDVQYPLLLDKGDLVVLVRHPAFRVPVEEPAYTAHRVDLKSGDVKRSKALPLPADAARGVLSSDWPSLRGVLRATRPGHFEAHIRASWTGGSTEQRSPFRL